MLLTAGAPLKVQEAYAAYIELLDYQLENNIDFNLNFVSDVKQMSQPGVIQLIELKLLSQSGYIVTYEFIIESEQRGQVQYNFESGQYRVEQQTISKYHKSYLVHLIAKLAEFSNLNQFPNNYTIAWY